MNLYTVTTPNEYEACTLRYIVMIGENRQYVNGDTAYCVSRPTLQGENGPYPATLPQFAKLWPVAWIDDKWTSLIHSKLRLTKEWTDVVTLIDKL